MTQKTAAAAASSEGFFSHYLQLVKPRLTSLALATTLVGFFIASRRPVDHGLLIATLIGAACIGGGANALNQYLEREIDAKMKRTENRPLPSGKLRETSVLVFGAVLSLAGVVELMWCVNGVTSVIATLTLLTYVGIYTPFKRLTPLNTFIGAVPGALPIVMGWTAAGGALGMQAAALFLLLYVWQLPHFYSIAWVYKEDYARGGLQMASRFDVDGRRSAWRILVYSFVLLFASLLPTYAGITGWAYFMAALLAGACLILFAADLVWRRMAAARRFISISILYLMVIIVTMMADKL